ncbi:hypothetical protein VDG1235_3825 [Verrucomicrobiia bacterium DG1235]|nr:hypothetical protein VDG1235_3825 [Verrucomicrobiae bacterium DG1235]
MSGELFEGRRFETVSRLGLSKLDGANLRQAQHEFAGLGEWL